VYGVVFTPENPFVNDASEVRLRRNAPPEQTVQRGGCVRPPGVQQAHLPVEISDASSHRVDW
jgi:hypothetical protein